MRTFEELTALASEHGNSFFILDERKFRSNIMSLRNAFNTHYPHTEIGYSYKTNYTPHLCKIADELGCFAEVVSEMEYELARRLGVKGSNVIFNGPYKAEAAFKDAALSGATLNLDSQRDVKMLLELAKDNLGHTIKVAPRCNFSLNDGAISRFGMDVDATEFGETISLIKAQGNIDFAGLHCHFPDRDLESFRRRAERLVGLSQKILGDTPPQFLNIGGGYFSNMPDSLRKAMGASTATFDDYGKVIGGILSKAYGHCQTKPKLYLEPGTAVVADTMTFTTKVISTKTIRGRNFATVAGSIFDISPTARSRNLPVSWAGDESVSKRSAKPFDIVGFTCIENDVLSENVVAPIEVDDFLTFENLGSYSVVMKPPFILPANPILLESDQDDLRVIKSRETTDYIFQNFVI